MGAVHVMRCCSANCTPDVVLVILDGQARGVTFVNA